MGLVSWIRKARRLLDAHKELILALLFLVLEAVSVVLDQIGKNKVGILLVAFLLSAFGFAITLYSIFVARRDITITERIQLMVVEIVFSVIQLIVAFIHYLLTVLQVKNDYNASAFPIAFAMISVVFCFINGRRITDPSPTVLPITNIPKLLDGSSPTDSPLGSTPIEPDSSTTDSTIENLQQPIGSTTIITIELDPNGASTNQVNPARSSTTVRRRTHVGQRISTIIFSKHLTKTDINARLTLPTSALEHIEIPEGENRVDLMVRDSAGKKWTFHCFSRLDGHPRPAFTGGWLEFVRDKGLQCGDEVILRTMQEDEAGGAAYMIRVKRTIKLMGKSITADL